MRGGGLLKKSMIKWLRPHIVKDKLSNDKFRGHMQMKSEISEIERDLNITKFGENEILLYLDVRKLP